MGHYPYKRECSIILYPLVHGTLLSRTSMVLLAGTVFTYCVFIISPSKHAHSWHDDVNWQPLATA